MGEPFFSILTPVYNPPIEALRAAVESVRAQSFPDWQLVLVDDRSPDPAVSAALSELAAADPRVQVVTREANGGIVAASQTALEHARGTFVALLDHDDALTPNALAEMYRAIQLEPEVDYLYSDEDKLDADGNPYDRFDKPGWSPERLRSHMYTGHLSVLRTELVREVGGFRPGYDGSQDHDLALRVTDRARQVVHVPKVLYHWRVVPGSAAGDAGAKDYAWDAGIRAVESHVARTGLPATVRRGRFPSTYQLERRLPPDVRVSIIIPTRGSGGLVWGLHRVFVVDAVASALAHTEHTDLEFVVVADTSTPESVLLDLHRLAGPRLKVVPFAEEFNFSRKCNVGFLAATGEYIVLLNDDVEVIGDGWLENLCGPLSEADVGMTGAKLFYSDGSIQHAGHVYEDGEYRHAFLGHGSDSTAAFAALHVNREVSGVTAACAAMRREVYEQIGGLSEALPSNFNDVDLSMKVRGTGRRILWLANVELYHFESRTRNPTVHDWERELAHERWDIPKGRDPYLRDATN